MDRLDQALRTEETLTPSAGFTAAVMEEVRREAETPRPLPFPWRRVLAVVGLGLAVTAAGVALLFFGVLPPQTLTAWAGRLLASVGDAALLLTFLTASLPRWLEV